MRGAARSIRVLLVGLVGLSLALGGEPMPSYGMGRQMVQRHGMLGGDRLTAMDRHSMPGAEKCCPNCDPKGANPGCCSVGHCIFGVSLPPPVGLQWEPWRTARLYFPPGSTHSTGLDLGPTVPPPRSVA